MIRLFVIILCISNAFLAGCLEYKVEKRVLLNAESFGFGPSAAIAEMFPYFRDRVVCLSYIGTGHTLDLQMKLAYDQIFDYSADSLKSQKEKFWAAARNYDIFITACDFKAARWAKEMNLQVMIYDPLTWYWDKVPDIVTQSDFYVAQNFFGVAERLKLEAGSFPEYVIIPAIVSDLHETTEVKDQDLLLVNIGGLSNPYFAQVDLQEFAGNLLTAIRNLLEGEYGEVVCVTSASIRQAVQHICPAITLQPQEVQRKLSASKLAIMTSGLGNIYEASAMQKQVIWLPPSNDSQGQQIKLLQQHGMVDYMIDWSDIFEDAPIDYFDSQEKVMRQIAICMKRLSQEPEAQAKFQTLLGKAFQASKINKTSALVQLAATFGIQGAKKAVESMLQRMDKKKLHDGKDGE